MIPGAPSPFGTYDLLPRNVLIHDRREHVHIRALFGFSTALLEQSVLRFRGDRFAQERNHLFPHQVFTLRHFLQPIELIENLVEIPPIFRRPLFRLFREKHLAGEDERRDFLRSQW